MAKNNEHRFENDIEELMTTELGWTKASERSYLKGREMGLDLERLTDFIKLTQQNAWRSFERSCGKLDVYRKFYQKFEDAVAAQGLIDVLRNGFRINGRKFFVISFRPENKLNQLEIIDELNAQSDGDFTDQDRVIMEMVIPLLCENPRLKLAAESQSEQAFMDSIYPKEFNKAMLDAYKLNDEAFKKLMYGYSKKSMVWGVESVVAKAGNYAIHPGKRYE